MGELMRRARLYLQAIERAGDRAVRPTHPRLCGYREDGLRPTVPSAGDLSVPEGKVERVLQELYVPLTLALRRRLDTRLRGGRAGAVGSSSF